MRFHFNDNISATTAILVAVFILFSIRVSSYVLPEKYYFSVSSVFKSDESLMLVDHPGVSGERFCQILRKYKITASDLELNRLDCTKERDDYKNNADSYLLSAKHRSQIYDTWIKSKDEMEKELEENIDKTSIATNIFLNLNSIDVYERQEVVFTGRLIDQVKIKVDSAISNSTSSIIRPYFSELSERIARELEPDEDYQNPYGNDLAVDDEQFERIRNAIAAQVSLRAAIELSKNEKLNVGFDDMQAAVEAARYSWEIEPNIEAAYAAKLVGPYIDIVDDILSTENLRPPDVKEAVASVHREFISENLPYYLASATIRFGIVFLAVLMVALVNVENFRIQNYSFGAALAAIMLTWPVLSLWSWVVREEWQAMKIMFLAIYALYTVAFFFTGKAAAHTAAYIRQRLAENGYGKHIRFTSDKSVLVFETSIKEIFLNFTIAASTSALVYTLNIIVPINA